MLVGKPYYSGPIISLRGRHERFEFIHNCTEPPLRLIDLTALGKSGTRIRSDCEKFKKNHASAAWIFGRKDRKTRLGGVILISTLHFSSPTVR